jgi:serine/threonine protein kinase
MPAAGEGIAANYRLERILGRGRGRGPTSIVFEAIKLDSRQRVAVKVLQLSAAIGPEQKERFLREVRVGALSGHSNIVEVYDAGESHGRLHIVMEVLDGESLEARVARVGLLSAAECLAILVPCMRALTRAHEAGVVHGELMPANVFLCRATGERPETPKLLGFGNAALFDASGSVASVPDARADVIALAGMLRALVRELPEPLAAAVERATALQYSSVEEFTLALEDASFAMATRDEEPALRLGPRWVVGASVAAVGLVALATALVFTDPRAVPEQTTDTLAIRSAPAGFDPGSSLESRAKRLLEELQLRAAPPACAAPSGTTRASLIGRAERIRDADLGVAALEGLVAEAVTDPELLVWAADRLRRAGSVAAARSALGDALRVCPQYTQAQLSVGMLDYEARRYDAAARAFGLALRHDPDYDAARFNLALTFMRRNDGAPAAQLLDDLERRAPNYPNLHSARAQAHWIAGNSDAAARDARLALARKPDDLRVRALLEQLEDRGALGR